jgi:hypothetical protein
LRLQQAGRECLLQIFQVSAYIRNTLIGIQFIRLVLSGTFDRLPDLQVILGRRGEVVLFYVERLAAMDRVSGLEHPVASYLPRSLYVTASGMFSANYLARAAGIAGRIGCCSLPTTLISIGPAETRAASWGNGGWMRWIEPLSPGATGTAHRKQRDLIWLRFGARIWPPGLRLRQAVVRR